MYRIFVFLSIAACINTIHSAVSIQEPVEKPLEKVFEVGCYIPQHNKVIPYNETYSNDAGLVCTQYFCREDNKTEVFICDEPTLSASPNCQIVKGDAFLSYPDCCEKVVCDE